MYIDLNMNNMNMTCKDLFGALIFCQRKYIWAFNHLENFTSKPKCSSQKIETIDQIGFPILCLFIRFYNIS